MAAPDDDAEGEGGAPFASASRELDPLDAAQRAMTLAFRADGRARSALDLLGSSADPHVQRGGLMSRVKTLELRMDEQRDVQRLLAVALILLIAWLGVSLYDRFFNPDGRSSQLETQAQQR